MCILERILAFQLLPLMSAVTLMGAQASAITLPELRQIITDSRESVSTAHLVYTEEFNDNGPVLGSFLDPNVFKYEEEVNKIHMHTRTKVDAILDYRNKSVKMLGTDLRDVNALLKEHHLPLEQKINVSRTMTLVIRDTYQMEFIDSDISGGRPVLGLCERPDIANFMFEKMFLGVIDKALLSEDRNPTLTKIDSDGESLLRIELTIEGQTVRKGTIECVPSLGYRFRRIEWRIDGRLIKETIADDYRDIDGVPYPFLYIERSFYEDGKVRRETKYVIEDVRLGVDLSVNDFKVFVPSGTNFTDTLLSRTIGEVEQGGYMGIDDVLALGMSRVPKR